MYLYAGTLVYWHTLLEYTTVLVVRVSTHMYTCTLHPAPQCLLCHISPFLSLFLSLPLSLSSSYLCCVFTHLVVFVNPLPLHTDQAAGCELYSFLVDGPEYFSLSLVFSRVCVCVCVCARL